MTDTIKISRELMPCPFCGGDPEASPEYQHNPGCYFDALASFKAAAQDFDFSLAPEVLKAWNRRAAPAPVAEPVSPWVAVSERQPLKWQPVLVAYESDADGEPCLDVGSAALGADGKFYGMGHFYVLGTATLEPRICVKPVTHWMPLPAAPEVKP